MGGNQADFIISADSQEAIRAYLKLQEMAKSATSEARKAHKELQQTVGAQLSAAISGMKEYDKTLTKNTATVETNKNSQKALTQGMVQFGYVLGDAASVTGGFDQVLRAVGNNIQQMAVSVSYSNAKLGAYLVIGTAVAQMVGVIAARIFDVSKATEEQIKATENAAKAYAKLRDAVNELDIAEDDRAANKKKRDIEALEFAKAREAGTAKAAIAGTQWREDLVNRLMMSNSGIGPLAGAGLQAIGFTEPHLDNKVRAAAASNELEDARRKRQIASAEIDRQQKEKMDKKRQEAKERVANELVGPMKGDLSGIAANVITRGGTQAQAAAAVSRQLGGVLPPSLAGEAGRLGSEAAASAASQIVGDQMARKINPAAAAIQDARDKAKDARMRVEGAKLEADQDGRRTSAEKANIQGLEQNAKALELFLRNLEETNKRMERMNLQNVDINKLSAPILRNGELN